MSKYCNLSSVSEINAIELIRNWERGPTRKYVERKHPILPKKGERNMLITAALPYVNNVPHLGNIIGCVLSADSFARYSRLRGHNTLYICGTDEYGTATEAKALEENLTPREICDKYHKIHKNVYDWFSISFDYFGRTTTSKQTEIAQDIFLKLYKNNNLVEDTVEQLYCKNCEKFLADRFVEGICPHCAYIDARGDQCDKCGKLINPTDLKDARCKICSKSPELRKSKHLYLNLPKIEPKLVDFINNSKKTGKWSANADAITQSWIQEGLKPRCITRDLKWGTPVPLEDFSNKVFYVWFDAPIGYISITANYTDEWKQWWMNPTDVRLVNFMAKDNVPFHTVVFPSSLLGTGDNYTLLNDISSTEYLSYENTKFSKSRGVGIFGDNARESGIVSDIFRLYLLGSRPETQDTSFNWADLISRNNNEYISNLGNFINRCLSLLFTKLGGKVHKVIFTDIEISLVNSVNELLLKYNDSMEKYRIREALFILFEISRAGNQYLQTTTPWKLNQENEGECERLKSILSLSANLVALLAMLLNPFAPIISEKIASNINLPKENRIITDSFTLMLNDEAAVIQQPSIFFTKIETSLGDSLRAKYSEKAVNKPIEGTSNTESIKNEIHNKSKEEIQVLVDQQVELIRKLKAIKVKKEVLTPEVDKLKALRQEIEGKKINS